MRIGTQMAQVINQSTSSHVRTKKIKVQASLKLGLRNSTTKQKQHKNDANMDDELNHV